MTHKIYNYKKQSDTDAASVPPAGIRIQPGLARRITISAVSTIFVPESIAHFCR